MTAQSTIRLTANFESNLESLESFLDDSGEAGAYDSLIEALEDPVLPNLERFPSLGRRFVDHPARSVETHAGIERLRARSRAISQDIELREYVMRNYLILYACIDGVVHLLSIRHHRQISFNFEALWPMA